MPIPEREFARSADWCLQHTIPLVGEVISVQDVRAGYRVHDANSYELTHAALDLNHVRQSVRYAAATRPTSAPHGRRARTDASASVRSSPSPTSRIASSPASSSPTRTHCRATASRASPSAA